MSEAQFWKLTPAKFFAMVDAVNNGSLREDYRAAIVTFTVRKLAGDKQAQLFDEFPEHRKILRKTKKRANAAQIRQNMRAYIEGREAITKGKKIA